MEEYNLERYGVKTNLMLESTKEQIKKTNLERYGYENALQSEKVKDKQRKTNLKRYGVEYTLANSEIREKIKKTHLKKYGVECNLMLESTKAQIKKTNLERYGCEFTLSSPEVQDKQKKTNLERYGNEYAIGSDEVQAKIRKSNRVKLNVDYPWQSPEIQKKVYDTKKKNGTLNTSIPEDFIFILLEVYFGISTVTRNEKSDSYPFQCDYRVPASNPELYIEYQGSWTHGKEPYNGSNLTNSWVNKSSNSKYYKNAVKVYTERDPLKRKTAIENNLNYLEIWDSDYKKGYDWLNSLILKEGLPLNYTEEAMLREFKNIKKTKGEYDKSPRHNRIIENFHPHYYQKERELWNNPHIRERLILNREKYKFKPVDELTNKQILQGFKISGIHVGFSFFSPLWIKAFIDEFNIKSVYDPCAGWGQRMLGACDVEYHGNDLSSKTYKGLCGIKEFLDLKETYLYNEPAEEFILNKEVDAIFTCPPYFDTEIYDGENTSTTKFKEYQNWLKIWWRKVIKNCLKSNPKYFSFIINHKYKEDMVQICLEENLTLLKEIPIGPNQLNHFQRTAKNSFKGEFLVILSKVK